MVWWWLLTRKPHSWALSLTACSVVSSLSLLCLVSPSLVQFFGLPNFYPPASASRSCSCFHTYGGVDPLGVFPLFLKKVEDIIAPN